MMRSLAERGSDAFGLATPSGVALYDSLHTLSNERVRSSAAIGYSLSRMFPKDIPQPLEDDEVKIAFEGRIYPTSEISDCKRALSKIKEGSNGGLREFVDGVDGSYALAALSSGELSVVRDMLGCKPLYWGRSAEIVALASERKALWRVGIDSPQAFPPGAVGTLKEEAIAFQRPDAQMPALREIDLDSASRGLSEMMVESIRKRSGDLKRVAVAYSGGVDSAVVACSSRLAGLDVELVTVTARGNGELEHARKSAEELGLPLVAKQYSLTDVEKAIPQVLRRMEKVSVMDVAVAIPILWVCQLAEERGFRAIFMGQGADELFGGYDRYITSYQRNGPQEAGRMMTEDVLNLSRRSFERDEQVSAGTRVELRLPFADRELVGFVLSLPMSLKIGGVEEYRQKLVLRRIARLQGMPNSIVGKPKRALQYTTGVDASIRLLARSSGSTPQEYVLQHYCKCIF